MIYRVSRREEGARGLEAGLMFETLTNNREKIIQKQHTLVISV
jgi:hypothetical protein